MLTGGLEEHLVFWFLIQTSSTQSNITVGSRTSSVCCVYWMIKAQTLEEQKRQGYLMNGKGTGRRDDEGTECLQPAFSDNPFHSHHCQHLWLPWEGERSTTGTSGRSDLNVHALAGKHPVEQQIIGHVSILDSSGCLLSSDSSCPLEWRRSGLACMCVQSNHVTAALWKATKAFYNWNLLYVADMYI